MRASRCSTNSRHTATAKGGLDVETPHAQSARHDRINREAADSGERSIYANGERSFAVPLKPYGTRIPIGP
jgi:hypothetical protein